MDGWVRTSVRFGLRWKELVVSQKQLIDKLEPHNISWDTVLTLMDKPDEAEKWLKEVIVLFRPQLGDGTMILLSFYQRRYFQWTFAVAHHSFPRVRPEEWPEEESLTLCPACLKPMPLTGKVYLRSTNVTQRGNQTVEEVCSGACALSDTLVKSDK